MDFHTLEKVRGRAVSFSHVIPQMRMYIREMSRVLSRAEANLESKLEMGPGLKEELSSWLESAGFLTNERRFDDFSEVDVVMKNVIPDREYMSDASDFAIGVYDCNTKKTFRRQFSIQEGEEINIAGKEALAVQMVLENVPMTPKPHRVRLHVDNQVVVHAMSHKKLKGSRNQKVNEIAKWVYAWQKEKACLVEIIYVNTKENLSDAPSRFIDQADEICISDTFHQQVEAEFGLVSVYDGAG